MIKLLAVGMWFFSKLWDGLAFHEVYGIVIVYVHYTARGSPL